MDYFAAHITEAMILVAIIIGLYAIVGGRENLGRKFLRVVVNVAMYRLARLMLNAIVRR